ncbi:MAG: hypothetical protein JJE47_11000 [Acidimicrobiia bacterium]|nr:hypothetical protein [Acidimicrobiia bacterium]
MHGPWSRSTATMAQVLTNLIGNALSYTPNRGRVEVRIDQPPGLLRVTVTDTGRGLSEEQLSMVFERFYRADRSLPGGTGIGLTIARSLARMHGGDLTASSPGLGHGSKFALILPRGSSSPRP